MNWDKDYLQREGQPGPHSPPLTSLGLPLPCPLLGGRPMHCDELISGLRQHGASAKAELGRLVPSSSPGAPAPPSGSVFLAPAGPALPLREHELLLPSRNGMERWGLAALEGCLAHPHPTSGCLLFKTQLLAAGDSSNTGISATHMGDPARVPGSCLTHPGFLWALGK